ncbi:MAG: radical SAM protein [Xanthobacteraceae bacterium]|nr:radical SAM protein [Xanthobacteraceae bacterium]
MNDQRKFTDADLSTPFVEVALWEVTTNCNLRCTYCAVSAPGYRGSNFDLSRIGEVADGMAAAKVRLVQISGHGETTIIPHWEAICREFTLRDIAICITSNFSKVFSDSEVDALARMTHITVSIDTIDRKLLKSLRRKTDIETVLYNMTLIRLQAQKLSLTPRFNWQCTLTDAVTTGLADWFRMGTLCGVTTFTLGNLLEYEALPDSPLHPARLDLPELLAACEDIKQLSLLASASKAELKVQPGIMEGINESLVRFGVKSPFRLPQPQPSSISW